MHIAIKRISLLSADNVDRLKLKYSLHNVFMEFQVADSSAQTTEEELHA